jgi:hypothetical protein
MLTASDASELTEKLRNDFVLNNTNPDVQELYSVDALSILFPDVTNHLKNHLHILVEIPSECSTNVQGIVGQCTA